MNTPYEERCGLCVHFQGEHDYGFCPIMGTDVSGYYHCPKYKAKEDQERGGL
jgi:hypothetical protein